MSGKPRTQRRKVTRVGGTLSGTFVVKLPEKGFEAHLKRIETKLDQLGYVAVPMTGQHILDMADRIRADLAAQAAAEKALQTAAELAQAPTPQEESND